MDLLIDDARTFAVDCIARNYETGVTILTTNTVGKLYLDFDLGGEKTGLDVLKAANILGILPRIIQLVTQNPVGLKQMQNFLKDNNYFRESPTVFVKETEHV